MTGIVKVPVEVLQSIFMWAKCEFSNAETVTTMALERGEKYRFNPISLDPNDEYPTYKSFRRVCKLWYHLATPLLFKTAVLLPDTDSWKNLEDICGKQHLAQHVRIIQLANVPRLPSITELKVWKAHAFNMALLPNGGPFAKIQNGDKHYFERYQRWQAAEKPIQDHWANRTAPKLDLQLLPHLRRIETVSHNELAVIKMRLVKRRSHYTHWRRVTRATRREVETRILEDEYSRVDYDNPSLLWFNHLDVLVSAIHRSGTGIPTLALRNTLEISATGERVPLWSLSRLELCIGSDPKNSVWGRHPIVQQRRYRDLSWKQTLDSLTELLITTQSATKDDPDIFKFLSGVKFPQLRNVHMRNVRTTYCTLNAFLQTHRDTIHKLHIEKPRISHEDWDKFCAQERASAWRAEGKQLYLTDVYRQGAENGKWS